MWLFRHGETEWNRVGRKQGRGDSPLTDTGVAQAEAMAAFTRGRGIERLLVSPLGRAQSTAAVIAAACGAVIETHEALAEMSFGSCATLTEDEIETRWPGLRAARERSRWTHRWPDGESYADVLERAAAWWSALELRPPAPGVAVVAHQAINCALTVLLAPCAPQRALELLQYPSTVLELAGDGAISCHELASAERPGAITEAARRGRASCETA
jgi:probable phosphoglycerate mutase